MGLATPAEAGGGEGWPECKGGSLGIGELESEQQIGSECTVRGLGVGIELVHFRAIMQPPNNSVYETTGNNIAMRSSAGLVTSLSLTHKYLGLW
jgi:hypothetical protein